MLLNNVVILGMAVPEEARSGKRSICVAGWQQEYGLIRLYPCHAKMGLKRWKIISIDVERNPQDTRSESFKLNYNDKDWLHVDFSYFPSLRHERRIQLLDSNLSSCVRHVNEQKHSLCLIKPYRILKYYLADNPTFFKPKQHCLYFDHHWVNTKGDFYFQPRISYQCNPECTGHDQSILEWGAFEWMRKNNEHPEQIFLNWKLNNTEYEHYLLIGNQKLYRNAFLVINIIPVKK